MNSAEIGFIIGEGLTGGARECKKTPDVDGSHRSPSRPNSPHLPPRSSTSPRRCRFILDGLIALLLQFHGARPRCFSSGQSVISHMKFS